MRWCVDDIIEKKQLKDIFKDKIICGLISDLINEPHIDNIILINFIKNKIINFNYTNQNDANIQITKLIWGINKDFSKGTGLEGFNRVVEYSKIFESLEYFTNLYKQYRNNNQLENN